MILEYGGVLYVDEKVSDYFGAAWPEAKAQAPFGQLPLLIADGELIAQSGSIVRYCASLVPGLMPADGIARAKCDAIFEASCELTTSGSPCNVNPLVNIFRGDDFIAKRTAYLELALPRIGNLAKQLGNGPFFFGAQPLYCDFGVYHVLSNTLLIEPTCLDAHANLRAFVAAFEALPGVTEYLAARPVPVQIGTAPTLEPSIVGSRARPT